MILLEVVSALISKAICAYYAFLRLTFTAIIPLIAPATGNVMRSIQENSTSLKALRAANIRNVNSIYNAPAIAPFSIPFCGFLKPINTPISTDNSFITMFTGSITASLREAYLRIIAKINTPPSEMRVAISTALSTSVTSFLNSLDFSIPKAMSRLPHLCIDYVIFVLR